jgi:exonuclease VII small subunit
MNSREESVDNLQAVYPGLDKEAAGHVVDLLNEAVNEFGEGEEASRAFEERLQGCAMQNEAWAIRTLFIALQAQGEGCQR